MEARHSGNGLHNKNAIGALDRLPWHCLTRMYYDAKIYAMTVYDPYTTSNIKRDVN